MGGVHDQLAQAIAGKRDDLGGHAAALQDALEAKEEIRHVIMFHLQLLNVSIPDELLQRPIQVFLLEAHMGP